MKATGKEVCSNVIKLAKDLGVDTCDVMLTKGKSLSLKAHQGSIDELKVSSAQTVGIRVIKENRVGLSYSESLEEDALKVMVKSATQNAANMKESLFEKISADNGNYDFSESGEESSIEDKVAFTLDLEKKVLAKDSRARAVPYNNLSESESEYFYLNSNNVFHHEKDFYYSTYTSALVEENGQNSMNYHGGMARSLKDLNVESYVNESLEHAINWLDAKPVETGLYDIIFTPDNLESLKGVFGIMYSAKAVIEKTNPFKNRMKDQVASDILTVRDIPHYSDAFFKSHVDSEGFKQEDLTLIESGKLMNFYHNSKTANELKMTNNFRASRGPRSGLGTSGTTQVWTTDNGSDEQVKEGKYLEIHSLQGLHSGANAISGEFSFGASGYLFDNGNKIPVKGITVSGNFYQLLNSIRITGKEMQATTDKSFFAPLIRFADMSVAGA